MSFPPRPLLELGESVPEGRTIVIEALIGADEHSSIFDQARAGARGRVPRPR